MGEGANLQNRRGLLKQFAPQYREASSAQKRLLHSQRTRGQHGLSTTRAGTLLKQQILIRTFQEQWQAEVIRGPSPAPSSPAVLQRFTKENDGHEVSFLVALKQPVQTGWR